MAAAAPSLGSFKPTGQMKAHYQILHIIPVMNPRCTKKTRSSKEGTGKMADAGDDSGLTPMQLMGARNKRMHSDASVKNGHDFKPRATDVFVVGGCACPPSFSLRTRPRSRIRHGRTPGARLA